MASFLNLRLLGGWSGTEEELDLENDGRGSSCGEFSEDGASKSNFASISGFFV